jgi:hypothetical protein
MIQAFIAGIRDPEIKRAAYCSPKSSFAETVAFALTQETAYLLSRPVYRVREIQAEENNIDALCERITQLVDENKRKFGGACFNCGTKGHFARDCRKKSKNGARNIGVMKDSSQQENSLS